MQGRKKVESQQFRSKKNENSLLWSHFDENFALKHQNPIVIWQNRLVRRFTPFSVVKTRKEWSKSIPYPRKPHGLKKNFQDWISQKFFRAKMKIFSRKIKTFFKNFSRQGLKGTMKFKKFPLIRVKKSKFYFFIFEKCRGPFVKGVARRIR